MKFDNLSYDWSQVVGRSRQVADRLAGGVEFLFKKNKVDYLKGFGSLEGPGKVGVEKDGKKEIYDAKNIIIATGCKPRELPPLPFDGKAVLSSKDAMTLAKQPKSMLIIGAGAIGVEFAYVYQAFGTEVTLVEMQSTVLPVEDQEIGKALEKSYKKLGVNCLTDTKVTQFKNNGDSVTCLLYTSPSPRDRG